MLPAFFPENKAAPALAGDDRREREAVPEARCRYSTSSSAAQAVPTQRRRTEEEEEEEAEEEEASRPIIEGRRLL